MVESYHGRGAACKQMAPAASRGGRSRSSASSQSATRTLDPEFLAPEDDRPDDPPPAQHAWAFGATMAGEGSST
jgi:hypothetical protein